jgi:dipeptidyl aminopeptidase/acylaminoacyl peptidase
MPTSTWRDRFTQQRIFATAVATADRTRGLVTMVGPDGMRLHAWDVPTGKTRPVPTPPANLFAYRWLSPDGRTALVLADEGGNELGHLTAVDLQDNGPAVDLTPALDPYTVRGVGCSRGGGGLVMDAVTPTGYRLYHLPNVTVPESEPRLLAQFPDEAWNCLLSADSGIATVDVTEQNPGVRRFAVRALRVPDGEPLGTLADISGSSVEGRLFSPLPGDATAVVTTDASGVRRPLLWHIADDTRRSLAVAHLPGDVVPTDWSDDGRYLLLCHTWRARQQLLRYDLEADRCEKLEVPDGSYHDDVLRTSQFGPDGVVLAATENLTRPLTVYRHRPGGRTEVALATGSADGHVARSVDIRSADGTLVQGWLAAPDGPGPHPCVIHLHGGPHWVELDAYDPGKPLWLDQGYAYLGLNVRGSTTFGTRYREEIWGDVGRWELEDIVASRQWLVDNGVADPGQVLLTGASYGAFLTLYALSVRPDLWAGGIAQVAIADWRLTHEDANPALRAAHRTWFAGTPDEQPGLYRDRSPLTHLERLVAPVLIRQARQDTRTPARQMEVYEREAARLGKPVTVVWEEGGHAPGRSDFPKRALDFAAECVRAG